MRSGVIRSKVFAQSAVAAGLGGLGAKGRGERAVLDKGAYHEDFSIEHIGIFGENWQSLNGGKLY